MLTDTIYIAGKITGLPDYQQKFDEAVWELREMGFTKILNPCCLSYSSLDYEQYMPICFAMIDVSDAVYFLNNWQDSAGAKREYNYAMSKNKKCVFERR